ncbi:protein of unknown function [Chryseobacterium sp. JV274]|nr:protein of unknown function [Chryseobacterium sp. JV274]
MHRNIFFASGNLSLKTENFSLFKEITDENTLHEELRQSRETKC